MQFSPAEIQRIVFVFPDDRFGEDEQLSIEDVSELHSRGVDWRAVCVRDSEVHHQLGGVDSSRLILLDRVPGPNLDRTVRDVLDGILEPGSVVHVHGSHCLGSILPWMLKHPKIPVVVAEGPRAEKRFRHFFQSFFYPRIDAVLVPSSTMKRRVSQMRPVLANRIRVLHPGLDFKVFNPENFDFRILRSKWGIDPEICVVGMIASREYKKAQSVFIKAAASFLRNEDLASRTRFVIVGFEQEGNEELIALIEKFHLRDQIILAPAEPSVPKVLGSLDVYVLPSSKAMFGLQAIEALAMGTPIICAAGPDSAEWTGNSQGGLTMRSGDSFDLQRKLRTIIEDPEELKIMGQRAVQYAREHYDRKMRTDRLLQIYARALHRRAAAE